MEACSFSNWGLLLDTFLNIMSWNMKLRNTSTDEGRFLFRGGALVGHLLEFPDHTASRPYS